MRIFIPCHFKLVLIDYSGQAAIRRLVEYLKDPYYGVYLTAITMLSRLGARGMDYIAVFPFLMYWRLFVAEWREGIRTAIPGIVECLKDVLWNARRAAIEVLSNLGAQGVG